MLRNILLVLVAVALFAMAFYEATTKNDPCAASCFGLVGLSVVAWLNRW